VSTPADYDDVEAAIPRPRLADPGVEPGPAIGREVLALLLVVAGIVGLVFVGFMLSVEAGIAAASVAAIAVGVVLGIDR
jgi:hypothetical protein